MGQLAPSGQGPWAIQIIGMPFYKDMELVCRSCGQMFIFTAGEQEFYADKGFLHEPTRCPRCRTRREGGSERTVTPPRRKERQDAER